MKVALDGTPLSGPVGGIHRYTLELSRALASEFAQDEYWLLSDQKFTAPESSPRNLGAAAGPDTSLRRRWWSYGVLRESFRLGVHLFHGTDFAVPYIPALPSVATVHDLSPWRDRSWGASRRVHQRVPYLLGLGLATMVIAPSESVRGEVADFFRVPLPRVAAVPLAAGPAFRRTEPPRRDRPYFLYAGVLEPRKNLPAIVDAWRQIRREQPVDLVLAGRVRADSPAIEAEAGIEFAGQVSDEALASLYSGAAAFLYPSLYEGFGLPVLEAMSCGAVVITSRDPALVELGAEATSQINAADPTAWADAMRTALTRSEWRREMGDRALKRSRCFSWAETARRTRDVYLEARRRFDT